MFTMHGVANGKFHLVSLTIHVRHLLAGYLVSLVHIVVSAL